MGRINFNKIYYGKHKNGKHISWTGIPDWVLRERYLNANEKAVYGLVLANSVGFGRMTYHKKIHKRDLAKQLGMTARAVTKALNSLRDKGLIDFPDNT